MKTYYKVVFGDKKEKIENITKKKELAFHRAWHARDFEIQLYWKRALYFWGFIGAIFVAYANIIKNENPQIFLPIILSFSGVVFSFAFYLANKGSKFWQENWETHIDMLEDGIEGNIYKTVFIKEKQCDTCYDKVKSHLLSGGAYSVSNINTFLSLFLIFVWCVIFLKSTTLYDELLVNIFNFIKNHVCNSICFYLLINIALLFLLIVFLCFMRCCVKSSFTKDKTRKIVSKKELKIYNRKDNVIEIIKKE